MNLLWLLGIPAILWLWAVSVPLTLNALYRSRSILEDCWWFVFNVSTAAIGVLGMVFCIISAFT
jgi:hypothetical protein